MRGSLLIAALALVLLPGCLTSGVARIGQALDETNMESLDIEASVVSPDGRTD